MNEPRNPWPFFCRKICFARSQKQSHSILRARFHSWRNYSTGMHGSTIHSKELDANFFFARYRNNHPQRFCFIDATFACSSGAFPSGRVLYAFRSRLPRFFNRRRRVCPPRTLFFKKCPISKTLQDTFPGHFLRPAVSILFVLRKVLINVLSIKKCLIPYCAVLLFILFNLHNK